MNENLTEVIFILDRSGSMEHLTDDTIGGFNSLIEKQKKEAGDCLVSTFLFDDEVELLHDRLPLAEIPKMTRDTYFARGCTALIDCIGEAVTHIEKIHRYARKEDVPAKTMFVITTDGMENASRKFTSDEVKKMIKKHQEEGWEFIFIGANIDSVETAARFGIRRERAVDYHADKGGTEALFACVNSSMKSYRACGAVCEDWDEALVEDNKKRRK